MKSMRFGRSQHCSSFRAPPTARFTATVVREPSMPCASSPQADGRRPKSVRANRHNLDAEPRWRALSCPRAIALCARADDPSKVPPPKPRVPITTQLYEIAMRNIWKVSFFGVLFLVGIIASCCAVVRERHVELETADDDDTSSANFGSRTYGNVPLSQQQQEGLAKSASTAPRSFGNVPLSKQKAQ